MRSAAATPGMAERDEIASEVEAEAAPANGGAVAAAISNAPEDSNVWPDEAAETAFLAEARGRGESASANPAVARESAEDNGAKALPALDELVKRIPPEAREILDELFRARFTAVRRVKKSELKD